MDGALYFMFALFAMTYVTFNGQGRGKEGDPVFSSSGSLNGLRAVLTAAAAAATCSSTPDRVVSVVPVGAVEVPPRSGVSLVDESLSERDVGSDSCTSSGTLGSVPSGSSVSLLFSASSSSTSESGA